MHNLFASFFIRGGNLAIVMCTSTGVSAVTVCQAPHWSRLSLTLFRLDDVASASEPPYSLIEIAKELKEVLDVLVTRRRNRDVDLARDTMPPAMSCFRDITMPALVVLSNDFCRLQLRDRQP
jgi:hypothetical protein